MDPDILFKMVRIQHLCGLGSRRRIAEEGTGKFLGYRLQEETPHFSTVNYNFRHRFTTENVGQISNRILMEMVEADYAVREFYSFDDFKKQLAVRQRQYKDVP